MPEIGEFEDLVRTDLGIFAKILGRSPEDLVRALAPYQNRNAETRGQWPEWVKNPKAISAVAYLKVVQVIREYEARANQIRPSGRPPDPDLERRVAAIEPRRRVKRSSPNTSR